MPSTASSCVELRDETEHVLLGRVLREAVVAGLDTGLIRGLVLAADVDVRGGVVADEHGREAEDAAELRDLLGDLLADPRRERPAVHDRRRHRGARLPPR